MAVIVDRRQSPLKKTPGNRQKFLERAKKQIKKTIKKSILEDSVKSIGKDTKEIRIKGQDVSEPTFRKDNETGNQERVIPGNDRYSKHDTEKKQKSGGGSGTQGGKGQGEDDFSFTLTKEEFLNFLFDDLELPNFIKESLMSSKVKKPSRAGFSNSGSPANLNIEKTFRKSISRRFALHRPSDDDVAEAERAWLEAVEKELPTKELDELHATWKELEGKQKRVPYIEENDLRYNLWLPKPKPESQAVVFCLMDVSGSMGEVEKDISKRFFLILYLFLEKKYDKVDIRFIRHTDEAEEVDEHKFFYDRLSGGTRISEGLKLIDSIIKSEYSPDEWNIYIAQCTDGDNYPDDNTDCQSYIVDKLLPVVQYFAYIEVSPYDRGEYANGWNAWPTYLDISNRNQNLVCKKIRDKSKVWTVFHQLFQKKANAE